MPVPSHEWIVLATLAASLVLFITDALRYDVIAGLVVVVLAATRVLSPEQAFAGFADPAVVLIGSMYVFGRAVNRWGIATAIAHRLLASKDGRRGPAAEAPLAAKVTAVSGLLSSVLSNTGVVATLIPVLSSLGRRLDVPVSRLLMPLSFGSLLGGLITLIGTSTNLAINRVIEREGIEPFGLFEFSHLGLILLAVGTLYFVWPGRNLLPRRRVDETLSEHYQVPKFVSEVLVEASSSLAGLTVAEIDAVARHGIAVIGIVRKDGDGPQAGPLLAPGPNRRIHSDDVLIVQGDPDAILGLRQELGLRERPSIDVDGLHLDSGDVQLVEGVVPAGSDLVGRSLAESEFRASTGLNVLAISQHAMLLPSKLREARLEVGDTLLMQGHQRDIERMRRSRRLLLLGELEPPSIGSGALITVGILALVLAVSAVGWMPLSVAALAGALALVLSGCVRPDEAREAVDLSVLFLVGGMLALGTAFHSSGLDDRVANLLLSLGSGFTEPRAIIALLLLATVALTQLTTNVTAGIIMAQVAIEVARELSYDPRALLLAVIAGASMAFMSPVAHQANTMVVGPGDYRFKDFLKVGTPLTAIVCTVLIVILPWLWPLRAAVQ
ncbi:SLC13 family permease [Engelhardtia mirabilis]|uniref:Citrate transporter n=1 Tax=Engelhardtia mirabilis TaxID=2528011 RepID=A0A518BJY2_9BACT|nr:Citrate transporter [Planctomycetes bacterium Pla133]QDV01604.1 Citrate transporter [Planctomycetes bacterium Pla86]